MQHLVLVAESDAADQLVKIRLRHDYRWRGIYLDRGHVQSSDGRVHLLLQIVVQEFEHQCQLLVGVHNVDELDDVGMVEFFEEGDFADGGAGDAFLLGLETNLLKGDVFAGLLV